MSQASYSFLLAIANEFGFDRFTELLDCGQQGDYYMVKALLFEGDGVAVTEAQVRAAYEAAVS